MTVCNNRGQEVATLLDQQQDRGAFTVCWDGTDESGKKLGSGIYFCRMTASPDLGANPTFVDCKKVAVVK